VASGLLFKGIALPMTVQYTNATPTRTALAASERRATVPALPLKAHHVKIPQSQPDASSP
jgi:hypothetical protein